MAYIRSMTLSMESSESTTNEIVLRMIFFFRGLLEEVEVELEDGSSPPVSFEPFSSFEETSLSHDRGRNIFPTLLVNRRKKPNFECLLALSEPDSSMLSSNSNI